MTVPDNKTHNLSIEDWQQVKSVFNQLSDLSFDQAAIQVDLLCKTATHIKPAVLQMLSVYQSSADETITPLQSAASIIVNHTMLKPSDLFGKYTIVKSIGTGGMGQVYLAQRNDEVIQEVAIKVLNQGAMDEQSQLRFDIERRILASLEHPNIARLIDAGTEANRAYYVMEYIDGIAIDQFCQTKQLNLKARLDLFQKICAAVSHAHNNLVVHRDLKPGNILVTDKGGVKLLDFGIAKPLEILPGTEQIHETVIGTAALTPQYAAPEQINGDAITVSCDIYVLGLLLYQMLTEQHALNLVGKTWGEIEASIKQQMPTLPSKLLSKNTNSDKNKSTPVNSSSWAKQLKGDLDAIVSHALKKEPSERYASVQEMAADVQRYLHHEPLQIKQSQTGYRLKKTLRRHWLPITALSTVFTILSASSFFIWQQSKTIKQERDVAEEVTTFLVDTFKSADPTQTLGTKITAEDILKQGVNQVNLQANNAVVKNRLLKTLGEVYLNLSEFDQAEALFDQYIEGVGSAGLDDEVDLLRAKLLNSLGDNDKAYQQIKALNQQLGSKTTLAFDLSILEAKVLLAIGQDQKAKKLSLDLVEQTKEQYGEASFLYAKALINEAKISSEKGNAEKTLTTMLTAKTIIETHFSERKVILADVYNRIARLYRTLLDFDRSLTYTEQAHNMAVKIFGKDNLQVAFYEHTLGNAKSRLQKYNDAINHYQSALNVKKKYLGDNSPKLASGYYSIAAVMSGYLGATKESLDYYAKAFSLLSGKSGRYENNLQIMRVEYTAALIELERIDEAKTLLLEMQAYFDKKQRIARLNLSAVNSYIAYALIKENNYNEAAKLLKGSIGVLRDRLGKNDIILIRAEKNHNYLKNKGYF